MDKIYELADEGNGEVAIICPYCGEEHDQQILEGADGMFYDGECAHVECKNCKNKFHASVEIYDGKVGFSIFKLVLVGSNFGREA